ncbi:MAG: metallophosphoesterase [Elusimicrobiaceae bacterium]|nr:metallophosphoesterase [Elusimicrobiaceae bacterium]
MGFFAVAGLILLIMQIVIGIWFYFSFPSLGWKIPSLLVPFSLTLLMLFTLSYTRSHYGFWEKIAYYLAYTWAGLVFIFFFIILAFILLQALCALFHWQSKTFITYSSMATLSVVMVLSMLGGIKPPVIKHVEISMPHAPQMKIAVLSDAHLGVGVSVDRFKKALNKISQENPDAVFVLGDLFEYGPHRQQYAQALADLKTKYGTFGVLGNHEYYVGLEKSLEFYKQANIHLLDNKIHLLPNGLEIIGVNDILTSRVQASQLENLLKNSHPDRARVLLSHQPLLTHVAAAYQIPLMLSGHTHNGQIFPFNFFVKLRYKYIYGRYNLSDKSQLYVTSGMFYWGMPLRFLTTAEIPLLHIKNHD